VKSETKVNSDINGGVPPLEKRIKAAQKLWAPREQLLKVEAECKKNKDTKCKKVRGTDSVPCVACTIIASWHAAPKTLLLQKPQGQGVGEGLTNRLRRVWLSHTRSISVCRLSLRHAASRCQWQL